MSAHPPPVTAGAPLAEARAVAVMVHGRDQGPEVMLDVVERLGQADVAYVLPVARDRSWYPGRFFDPVERNEPWLTEAIEACDAAIPRDRANRTVLVGFSQGACLIAELVCRRPRVYGGVAILTGALIGPDGATTIPPALPPGLPVFCLSGRHDAWVPLERAQHAAQAFAAAGARVTFEVSDDPEHRITDAAVAGVRTLLRAVAGAATAGSPGA